jgi:uncharacterized protein Yka (UPF0111/DUF47 family)
MKLAIEELYRSQKYHQRQLEENLQSIRSKEEAIELLKQSNEKHIQVIDQINALVEQIKAW